MKIPKIVKVACIVIIVVIIAIMAFSTIVSTDVLSSFATGSEKLTPDGRSTGKALVVYNPGLSGAPKDAATKIAGDLQSRGYEVELAGIRSGTAANTSGYDVIVVGGPIYSGKASSSVQSYLKAMNPPANAITGAFATGSIFKDQVTQPFPASITLKAVVLLFQGDDSDKKCSGFADELLSPGCEICVSGYFWLCPCRARLRYHLKTTSPQVPSGHENEADDRPGAGPDLHASTDPPSRKYIRHKRTV